MKTNIIKNIKNMQDKDFEKIALSIFHYQYEHNSLYKRFVNLLKINPKGIQSIYQIPHLPIQFFKNYHIKTGEFNEELIYTSSGTSSSQTSKHFVCDKDWYLNNTLKIFEDEYGSLNNYRIFALLPSYLERKGSSLIDMVDFFMKSIPSKDKGFFLYNNNELAAKLLEKSDKKTLLIGVSFALLDFAEKYSFPLENTIIMETGGMKGRRKEMTRKEVHHILKKAFQLENIHSEYGMTELLSQGYSKGNGIFNPNQMMKVWAREIADPFEKCKNNRVGAINIIDLANIDSCAFIATDDLGRVNDNGQYEILGRLDNSDVRGCNLMVL